MQLNIEFSDGTHDCIPTGWEWAVGRSAIHGDSIYDGETYDARCDSQGWDTAEGETKFAANVTEGWTRAIICDGPGGKLVASAIEPIRVTATLKPVSIVRINKDRFVVDVGQNFAGWSRIRVRGPRAAQVTLKHAEMLYPDGQVNQENLRLVRARDTYILKGDGVEECEPRFTYHGFRYVLVEGWPGELTPDDIDGRVVHSDVAQRGSFQCDHDLVNRIQRAVEWTEKSNLHSVPTDCPQRDERLGWLNDMTARAEEAIYNYDMIRFFSKWLDDIADAQDDTIRWPQPSRRRFIRNSGMPPTATAQTANRAIHYRFISSLHRRIRPRRHCGR